MVVWYWWWCLHPGGVDPTFFWMDGGKGVLHKWFFRNDTASTKKIRKQWKNLEWLKKSNFPRMCCFLLTTSFASLKLVQRWRPRRLVVTPWQAIELGKNRIRVPQVSALLGRIPSAVGYQPTLATDLASLQASKWFHWNDRFVFFRNDVDDSPDLILAQERITTTQKGSITSVQVWSHGVLTVTKREIMLAHGFLF